MAPHLDPSIKRIGKALQDRANGITREQLPKRWVELILRLNELEREGEPAVENPRSSRH